jgi:hypothetical protein
MTSVRSLLAVLLLVAGAARAEQACFVSYAGFEETVKHLDLDLCPGGTPTQEEGFCRLALQGSDVLIYEFRHVEDGPCLVRVHRSDFNDFVAQHGVSYPRP